MKITKRCAKIVQLLLFCIAAGHAAAVGFGSEFEISGPTANDVDNVAPTVLEFSVGNEGRITSLAIRLKLDASGNGGWGYWDNLFVQVSHAGVDVVLTDLQGDAASRVSSLEAIFSDGGSDLGAALQVDGPTTGTFNPLQPLSAFNGLPLKGTWTVKLWDDTVPFDGTDLSEFSLIGSSISVSSPASIPAISVWGIGLLGILLALVGIRRLAR